jgi:pimeloyl-ACP methyl ester carboxylesterase
MLHWTPWSSLQYVPYLPLLAEAGYAVIAPDHMGYGFSDPRPSRWMVEDYADCLAAVLDDLHIDKAMVAGGHFSSEIAVEFHLRHPDRVTHLVLDGSPVWDQALRDEILKVARQPTPDWNEDGSHIAWVWERSLWLQRMWDKNFEMNDAGAAWIRRAVVESMLAQQSDDSADALRNYDMEAKLKQVSIPTLALTAETDPLNNCHDLVMNLVAGCEGHTFPGSHPHHWPERAKEYADVLIGFLNG